MPKTKDVGMVLVLLSCFFKGPVLALCSLSCCFSFHKSEAPIVFRVLFWRQKDAQNLQQHTNGHQEISQRALLNRQYWVFKVHRAWSMYVRIVT